MNLLLIILGEKNNLITKRFGIHPNLFYFYTHMKVLFRLDSDEKYVPLNLTPGKIYDVIKVIDEIFYMIKSDDGETRTYYNSFFEDISQLRQDKIDQILK